MLFDRNTVVWASAGTGKTRRLVEVYLELIEAGMDPLRVVTVTFTEKAAAEMRERIRQAIYSRLEATPMAERGRWMKVLGMLPAAPISTIHGFCALILRDHGLAAGLDPGFSVLNEQRSLDLARESAIEVLRREIRSGNRSAAALFGDFGLERLVDTLVRAGYWLNSLGKAADWLTERVAAQARLAEHLALELDEYLKRYNGDFEAIGAHADELDARKAKHAFKKRDDSQAVLPRLGQIAGVATSEILCDLVGMTLQRFREKKEALNALDFDDLLLRTRDLLAASSATLSHYQSHFQALLVDEFQDTDEVQAAIIEMLVRDPADSTRFAPRKLMIVGDPKQSIYRFRRARVTVFFRMLQAILQNGGKLDHLQENRRSAPPIAAFANRLCESMMDGMGKGEPLPDDVDFSYRVRFTEGDRLIPKSDASFIGITYVVAEDDARAAQGRGMEAEAMARLLRRWKNSGQIGSWKEVAMLFRAATNIGLYVDALEKHDIPLYVVQGTYFYRKTEISDLVAVLELILRPNDPLLRATVQSSSLAGLTFDDLLARTGGDRLDDILKPWIQMRDSATAAEILQDVLRRTNFDVVMMAQRNGAQRAANIGKLIEITRDFARQGTTALDDVVRHLRRRVQDPTVRESEAQIVDADDDVVRLLTVHQAKGLEFEIAIVPDLAAKTSSGSGDRAIFSDRWGILAGAAYGLHRKPLPHALMIDSREEEDDQQYEEEKRLLYVAVTRAKRMLVLGEGFATRGGPWLKWLQAMFEQDQPGVLARAREGKTVKARFKDFTVDVVPAALLNVPEQLPLVADVAMIGGSALAARLLAMQKAAAWQKPVPAVLDLTPSDLATMGGCLRYFHFSRIAGLIEPGLEIAGDSAATRLGSVAHKLLERGDRPADDVLAQLNLSDLGLVFDSGDWTQLQLASPEAEMPFMMLLRAAGRDCWIRGRMDAVVAADVPRVIDYKFARRREGAEVGYDIQLMVYSLALMKSFEVDRAIGELWYLRKPMKIVCREYRLADAERQLTLLLENYIRALESGIWPAADRTYCDLVECGFRQRCWGFAVNQAPDLTPEHAKTIEIH